MRFVAVILAFVFSVSTCSSQNPREAQREIRGVIREGTQPQLVRGGFHGLEGPAPLADGSLYFSAIEENRIYHLDRSGSFTVWRENTNGTNGLYRLKDGHLLCAEGNGGRVLSIDKSGLVRVLAGPLGGDRQPNDLIPDRKGGIYFTNPARRPAPNVAPKVPGNVYYVGPTGEIVLLDDQIARPNGITLSLDQKTLYVDDTEGQLVYAFDVQPNGSVKNKRPYVKLHDPEPGTLGQRSRADGMALDSEGRLYVATASGVQVIGTRGDYLGTIRVPAVARNLAFDGLDRHTLYLTAMEALYKVSLQSQGPSHRAK